MLYQIISFVLEVATSLFGGACLLRLYMQHQRVPFGNPVGRFVFALTDGLVLHLRRVVPSTGRWDMASLVGAYLLKLTQFGLLWLLAGGLAAVGWVPLLAVFGLVQMAISGLTGLLIVYAILSWTQAGSPLSAVIDRLCAPFLAPFRRILPLVGGIDLSPLVLLVVLQVAAMVLASLQQSMLR
ncbi:MAG: YggT family protein [Comamonadaceae bacterium]|jgi:YggT family protein|uniref:YggT family protein n=1 Tax=Candidatus Skiveiella danica TaxID=3386177 RepID=UPI001B46AA79|nr:YggT family protein [Comamonadaceae bacterium]MBK7118459.1 YggT family protein [Comamonadaceae bacterium]MBK9200363.1 YggT family protein [Betaproteobacteria bacterium]MBP6357649.1 YggT family protein [Burkholderiaceae bacterium]